MELKMIDLSKSYGSKVALHNFNATLTPGVYGLLGPNGAGKSTLMNILADNLRADQGQVLYDGKATSELGKSYRQILGFMPQQQGLYDGFTALRFMYYMAALKGLTKNEANERIPQLLNKMGLYEERHKKLGAFSGGMKQRILIAQAVLNDPDIIILDEPTAGLDPSQRIAVRNFISEISIHKIVLLATHVVSDIAFIAKEIIILKNGELIEKGSITELLTLIEDNVYEIGAAEEEVPKIKELYKVSNIVQGTSGLSIRILNPSPPAYPHKKAVPSLEDVYLYLFGQESDF